MCDFCNDFEDDLNQGDFMNDDSFGDSLEGEMDESFTDDTELDDESIEAESQDGDLTVDPFFIGGALGFGYEQGLREQKRRKRKRFRDESE